jgi:hypothetical protein
MTDIGYAAAHGRVAKARGRASEHRCVDCPSTAQDWSYDYNDPKELRSNVCGMRYSTKVNCYSPRCKPCHATFDQRHRAHRAHLGRRRAYPFEYEHPHWTRIVRAARNRVDGDAA